MAPIGVEPIRPYGHRILNPARLPIPPRGLGKRTRRNLPRERMIGKAMPVPPVGVGWFCRVVYARDMPRRRIMTANVIALTATIAPDGSGRGALVTTCGEPPGFDSVNGPTGQKSAALFEPLRLRLTPSSTT